MNTIDCILNRHCYRGEYVVDEIPSRKDLTTIMEDDYVISIKDNKEELIELIKTDEKGVAQLDISDFISGKYHVTALFKGNENYTNSSDDIKFNAAVNCNNIKLWISCS